MTVEELKAAKAAMSQEERLKKFEECQDSGGCGQNLVTTTGGVQYCRNCLTLFVNGYAQDPPLG